jgi:hypothetical protein
MDEDAAPLPSHTPGRVCLELAHRLLECLRSGEEAPVGLPLLDWLSHPGLRGFAMSKPEKLGHTRNRFGNHRSDIGLVGSGQ